MVIRQLLTIACIISYSGRRDVREVGAGEQPIGADQDLFIQAIR